MIEMTETPKVDSADAPRPMFSSEATGYVQGGYDRLWDWFSLSYASFLTLPRAMMHEMPEEWQWKMAALLEEWDKTWDSNELPEPSVTAKKDGKFTKWPDWLLNYRHPNKAEINKLRS